MSTQRNDEGFSTVELLISLFVAAAFIATAFQLFSIVVGDSNAARLRSRASNIAYENLRLYSATAKTGGVCAPAPANITPAAPSDLPLATITISFSCPYGNSSKTSRIKVTVNYNTTEDVVEEALDVTR